MKRLFGLLACVAATCGAAEFSGAGKLGYFTAEALATADMSGLAERIDATLARCEAECAAAEDLAARRTGVARDMLLDRVEIARSLRAYVADRHSRRPDEKDMELLAWQGAEELRVMYDYFAAEAKRERTNASAPKPVAISVRDFGAKGDGKSDDGPAFRSAFAAARAKGVPVRISVPDGIYLVKPDASAPKEQFHLVASNLVRVAVEGGLRTEIRFADAVRGGFSFLRCEETVLKNVTISYVENPSTQGTIVEERKDPYGLVFRRDPGYPDPDLPRFLNAHSRRFTRRKGPDGLYDGSTVRMGPVKRLGDDLFLFTPLPGWEDSPSWRACKAGDRVSVIARYSEGARGFPVYIYRSSFTGAENVTIYDAPGQNFIVSASYAPYLVGCTVRPRPGTDDLVSSNADGCMSSGTFGIYIRGCTFEAMEDDGLNIGFGGGGTLGRVSDDRYAMSPRLDARRETAFLVDAVSGLVKAFVRRDAKGRLTRPLTTNVLAQAECDAPVELSERIKQRGFNGSVNDRKPDRLIEIPSCPGAVVRDCTFRNLRGMGIQLHCADMLVDGCTVENVTGPGANVNPLFAWGMLFNVHNVIVRNCKVKGTSRGFNVKPGSTPVGYEPRQRMIQGIKLYDNEYRLGKNLNAVRSTASGDVEIERTRFSLTLRERPDGPPRTVSFKDAASIVANPATNGGLWIRYAYENSPVKFVYVTVRRDADGATRGTLDLETEKGWYVEEIAYPEVELPLVRGGDASDDRIMVGSTKGGVIVNPAARPVGWTYKFNSPGKVIAQFAASWDGESGFYFGVEDSRGCTKRIGFTRGKHSLTLENRDFRWETGSVKLGYDVAMRDVKRGAEPLVWQDFADIYRKWNDRQPWMRTPYVKRSDVPEWMKKGPAMVRFSRQWQEHTENIAAFTSWWRRNFGKADVVSALWGWEKVGTWWGPDYLPGWPSAEDFAKNLDTMRKAGFHPFVWPSGYNWCECIGARDDGTYDIDYRGTFVKDAASHIAVNRDGTLFSQLAFWLRNGRLTSLCGGDAWTQNWWNDLTMQLGRVGCDIVQVDQVVGGRFRDCWSSSHGHPVGPGRWKTESFRRQMETMRAAMKSVQPDGFVGIEEPNERMIDVCGIQDYRDLQPVGEEFASVFNYIYHGYLPTFQSNPYRDLPYAVAHGAVDGQIPFYSMLFDDMRETRPALVNGGFENLTDQVRGPAGWERYAPVDVMVGCGFQPIWDFTGWNLMGWRGFGANVDRKVRHSGETSLILEPTTNCPSYFPSHVLQVTQTVRDLRPGEYTFSAWVKSERGGAKAAVKYGTRRGEIGEMRLPETCDWTEVKARVVIEGELRIILFAELGAKVWIDDLKLVDSSGCEVMRTGDTPYQTMMKNWVRLYAGDGLDFMANGFQEKPPRLECATFKLGSRTVPAVCHAAYRSLDGRHALVLANATEATQTCSCTWRGRRRTFTLARGEIRLVLP